VISSTVDRGVPDLGGLMRELDAAAPYELLDVCAVWLQRCVTASDSALLLADYAQVVLEAVPASLPAEVAVSARAHAQSSCGERHHIDDSPAGTAYRDQRIVELESTDDRRVGATSITTVFVPVSIRAERVGVLRVALERASISPALLQTLQDVAQLVAHVITGARRYTDRFEVLRRNQPLKLAAEIQWELLPVQLIERQVRHGDVELAPLLPTWMHRKQPSRSPPARLVMARHHAPPPGTPTTRRAAT